MKGKYEDKPHPYIRLFHLTGLNGTYLCDGCDKHKIKAENTLECKGNVAYKQKNVFVNRMTCPNVESLPHTEDIILFSLKTSYIFVLSHSNYLMLVCNKLGIF